MRILLALGGKITKKQYIKKKKNFNKKPKNSNFGFKILNP